MANEVLVMDAAIAIIDGSIKKAKAVKMVKTEIATGISWFEGKERLVKVITSKKGITLEINQVLDKELIETIEAGKAIFEHISPAKAKAKHLGTMKYLYKAMDTTEIASIIDNAIKNLRIAQAKAKTE